MRSRYINYSMMIPNQMDMRPSQQPRVVKEESIGELAVGLIALGIVITPILLLLFL